jgi:hypothetical protein
MWNCIGGMDGWHHNIETLAATSTDIARTWVGDRLPMSRKLAPLALKMIDHIVEWIHMVHKHLDIEFLLSSISLLRSTV